MKALPPKAKSVPPWTIQQVLQNFAQNLLSYFIQ